jgi:hypothetical protein
MMDRELNLFERPVEMCYCVPGGASACAPCRDRRAEVAPTPTPTSITDSWLAVTVTPKLNQTFIEEYIEKIKSLPFAGQEIDFVVFDKAKQMTATEVAEAMRAGGFLPAARPAWTLAWDPARDSDKTVLWTFPTNRAYALDKDLRIVGSVLTD